MTKLLWDQPGERRYETGLDRGVLYLSNRTGIAWNGLVSVDDIMDGDSSDARYFDGVKYLDFMTTGDLSATLKAFTYPDEFLDYEGIVELGPGLYVSDQDSKLFGLSYRTKIGNDTEDLSFGYKIHILYNLTVIPSPTNYETLTESSNPIVFEWNVTGVPESVKNHRPTAHVIFDSRFLDPSLLSVLEDLLYGKDTGFVPEDVIDGGTYASAGSDILDGGTYTDPGSDTLDAGLVVPPPSDNPPRLPTIDELVDFVGLWAPRRIIPQTVTGLAQLVSGIGDITQIKIPGVYSALPNTRLTPTTIDGIYLLV